MSTFDLAPIRASRNFAERSIRLQPKRGSESLTIWPTDSQIRDANLNPCLQSEMTSDQTVLNIREWGGRRKQTTYPHYLGVTLSRARFRVVPLLTFHPYVVHVPEAYDTHTRTLTCSVTVAVSSPRTVDPAGSTT